MHQMMLDVLKHLDTGTYEDYIERASSADKSLITQAYEQAGVKGFRFRHRLLSEGKARLAAEIAASRVS